MLKMIVSGNRFGVFLCCAALGLFASPAVRAADSAAAADQWQFEVMPYLWAAGLKADVGVHGVTADVDLSFNDILDNLDWTAAALFEARNGPWTIGLDSLFMRLKDDKSAVRSGPLGLATLNASLDVKLTQQLYQPFLGYRLTDGSIRVDAIGGARYTNLNLELSLDASTSGPLLPSGERSIDATKSWWDPIVGVRVSAPLAEKWSVVGYADVGVGENTTYQAYAGMKWQFSQTFSSTLGYRYLRQNYDSGNFHYDDVTMSGAFLGVGIRF
jgi:opacity protein-like surface antigen